jgi:DNA-binding MarR family transcriptional regulator
MGSVFEELAGLNRLIHEPARLAILTALSYCQTADFLFLQRLTGLSAGNLSVHLTKLEDVGLICTEKHIVARRTKTQVRITDEGRIEIQQHWKKLEDLRSAAGDWKIDDPLS